jgi:predicted phosphodiesterase
MISDTHTFLPNSPQLSSNPYRYPLPKADVLLHAGDITKVGRKSEYQQMLDMLTEVDAEVKIVIAGNHDITLDEDYYSKFGQWKHRHGIQENPAEIRELWVGEKAKQAGIVYMDEGLKTFKLKNGAQFRLYASPYQPEFRQWAFAYERHIDRFNPSPPVSAFQAPNPVPSYPNVDIMLTHGPPFGVLDRVYHVNQSAGCENLLKAVSRARPRLHVFGHIHEGYGARRLDWETKTSSRNCLQQDPETVLENRSAYCNVSSDSTQPLRFGEETLFVNASVVTVNYVPKNAPWLIDIDLPATGDSETSSHTLSSS